MLHFDAVPPPVADLLQRLSEHRALAEFALGGGTSLALRTGHRLSIDLDYFTGKEFSPDELFTDLELGNSTVLSKSANSLTMDANGVKVDLLRHNYKSLSQTEKMEGVLLISLPDLAAMKLNAITNRGSKKDFYDLAELLRFYPLSKMIEFFSAKYPTTDPFVVMRSLAWFEDADSEPNPVSLRSQTWPEIKQLIINAVSEVP